MAMQVSPRERYLMQAENQLRKSLLEWFNDHDDLSTAEELRILSSVYLNLINRTTREMVRLEHQGEEYE